MKNISCNQKVSCKSRCQSGCKPKCKPKCKPESKPECKQSLFERPDLAQDLLAFMGKSLLVILDDNQLNILNQVFRPIFCGDVEEVTNEYVVLKNVNIKMSNAPEYIFPTPLVIPLVNIVWFTPFDPSIRFSLF